MNVVDLVIIIILAFGALLGFKRGFTKELVIASGFVVSVILAFVLKNTVSEILYMNAPFFKFGGLFKGVTVLNIALYELIAFIIVFSILMIVVKILVAITGIFESFLNMTILLGIPSKILGMIVGAVEHYIWIFIILYVMSLPIFNTNFLEDSKFKNKILNDTPILSKHVGGTVSVFNEFASLKEKYKTTSNANEFNLETLDLFLKYKIVTINSIDKLVEKDKLVFSNIENLNKVLDKYREGK